MPKAPDLPKLYAIVDVDVAGRAGWTARDLARAYLAGGARLLQVRAKALDGGPFLELAAAIVEDARTVDAQVIVNDRARRATHAVLAVYVDGRPLILDNLRNDVVAADLIGDYEPVYSINEQGWWLHRR